MFTHNTHINHSVEVSIGGCHRKRAYEYDKDYSTLPRIKERGIRRDRNTDQNWLLYLDSLYVNF